ncbi:hypothetical protein INT45_013153 [Circinella minor]|uniref:GATA-type domain-containing protein n=1 Tax=Circinella minor TaxID=1195481 RepID=A0A8H7VKY2_9FUNG|nr:hypothetical protein INT45_013153 [Circinella minor]
MASLARPRANSERIPGTNGGNDITATTTLSNNMNNTSWIPEAFHRYTLPVNLNQDSISPDGGWTHRIQSRFLGVASLKAGSLCFPNTVSFYEITESEISEIASSSSSKRSSPSQQQQQLQESSDNNDPDCCVDALLSLSTSEIFLGRSSPIALPPKKRKRRRVIRYDVIFCLDTIHTTNHPPLDREYFLFPRDAVVEAVNQTSPFEVLVSYHLPKSSESSSTLHSMYLCSCTCNNNYPSKLEEFAAVCSSSGHFTSSSSSSLSSSPSPSLPSSSSTSLPPTHRSNQRRLTDPGLLLWKPDCHVLNMQLFGVSRDLYIAMKQSVSGFETVCQRTMELMRLHTERLTSEKKEDATSMPIALTKTEIQSEEEDMYDKRQLPWSSDDDYEDEDYEDDQTSDFCMTSPHSKSSSSARGSPPASSSLSSSITTTNNTTTTATNNSNNTPAPSAPTSSTTSTTATGSTKRNTNNNSSSLKKCLYCGSKSTPMWRRGPQGAGTLCNACGVKWKHGKILCGNDTGPAPTLATTTTSSSRRRSSSNKSNSSNNERKRKTTTKKRSKAKERNKRPPPPPASAVTAAPSLSEDDDLMTGIIHNNNNNISNSNYTTTTTSSVFPRNIHGTGSNATGAASSWETQHASSLSSYSQSLDDTTFSPLESFSSSPNSSTSIHDSMMLDKFSAGVDAVEAATVLTLLKRS